MSTQIGITHRERGAARAIEGGSTTEAIGGIAAVVLAILGLIGLIPGVLASIAAIAVGVGMVTAGGTIAAEYSKALGGADVTRTRREVRGGMGMEVFAGVAGIVLGILALIGLATPTLLAITAIVLGAALIMASGSMARLDTLIRQEAMTATEPASHDAVYVATGSEVLVGVGTIVLGILALAGHDPMTLVLVSMLAIGASLLLSGSSLTARFFGLFS